MGWRAPMTEKRAWLMRLLDLAGGNTLFKALIEHCADLVAVLDREGRFIYTSPGYSTQLGYDDNELIGKPATDYVHPDDMPQVSSALRRLEGSDRSPAGAE